MTNFSRRRFLKRTLLGTSMLVCGKLDLSAFAATQDKTKVLLEKLKVDGRVIVPTDADYGEARENYNARFSSQPAYIIFCENENDVSESIKWARKNGLPVSIRSGGHSYEGFSVIDAGVVIDLSKMDDIKISANKKTVVVQSGVTLMPLYEKLWESRLVVPAGSCASVGIGGSTLGGGFGLLARSMGLTCDNLVALKMVDADGKAIEANDHTNSDLLWACKGGGGGNFGAVTEFTFKTHPINNVTVFRVKWKWDDMAGVIRAWQKWAPNVDDRITSVLTMTSKKSNRVSCVGVFLGGQVEVRKLIAPLLAGAVPISVTVNTSPFIDAVNRFSGLPKKPAAKPSRSANAKQSSVAPKAMATRVTPPTKPTPDMVHAHIHPRFKNTSDYVSRELDDDAIKIIVEHLNNSPLDSSCLQFDSYGGNLAKVAVKDSAFCHRGDTKFCMHYQANWRSAAQDERNIKWINDFKQAMKPHVSGFAYVNYCDRDIEDWPKSYYGENLARLVEVKKKYDPDNFFNFAQSIPIGSKTTHCD